jgi:hypothetical protein
MIRGYRWVIVALAMLLVGDAKQNQSDHPKRGILHSQKPVQPVNQAALRVNARDLSCKRGEDDRLSDLCAQWKAADAAYDAARWGWWQMILGALGLIVGGGTLIAAVAAAFFAKEAAEAAKATLEHEKLISGLQLNAILHIESVDVVGELGLLAPQVSVLVKNVGSLSAKSLVVAGAWGYRQRIEDRPLTLRPCVAPKGISPNGVVTIQLPPSEPQRFNRFSTLYCQFELTWEHRSGEMRSIREIHKSDGENFALLRDY